MLPRRLPKRVHDPAELRWTTGGFLKWRERMLRKPRASPLFPKIVWVVIHVLVVYFLSLFENDMTDGGDAYKTGVAFSLIVNAAFYLALANSNPGYVEEDEKAQAAEFLSVQRNVASLNAPGGDVESGAGGGGGGTTRPAGGRASSSRDLLGPSYIDSSNAEILTREIPEYGEDDGGDDDGDDDTPMPVGQNCKHCDAWQGLRTKHCHDCGRCVRKLDHHCFWVGSCVGEKNHARFTSYLATETACVIWALHISGTGLRYHDTFGELFAKNAGPLFLCVFLFFFALFVGSLLGFHAYLIVTGQSTWEVSSGRDKVSYLRGVPKNVYPFSLGPVKNVMRTCCEPPPPRYEMRPMKWYRAESKRETIWENRYWVCC